MSAVSEIFRGKRVLVTGHTGFKGAWLSEWLLELGADLCGCALPARTERALFTQLGLEKRLRHHVIDVRDCRAVCEVIEQERPEFLFHLAAQPLVRLSYQEPVQTFETNIMGTAHVLEALRLAGRPCVAIAVTTDKCYENREWIHSYREDDPMGGYDPYSSSKGAAELVIAAYRRSFFGSGKMVSVASARAGNVIGGGDWAADRIVPDAIRSLVRGEAVNLRNPSSTRPWQHVLEPLSGYLLLAARIAEACRMENDNELARLCSPFNFGPALDSNRAVRELVDEVLRLWPGKRVEQSDSKPAHEAGKLMLATDKAFHVLGWRPVWSFEESVRETVSWYRHVESNPSAARPLTVAQIASYEEVREKKWR